MSGDAEEDMVEKPLSQIDELLAFPPWYKWGFAIVFGLVSLACIGLYVAHILNPRQIPSPNDLQLGSIFIFSSTVSLLVVTPWSKLGIRINKIGPIEFERVINEQAKEHIEEISELRQLLFEVDVKLRGLDEISSFSLGMASVELRSLIKDFLREHSPTAYSPLRMQKWGAKQKRYENLSNHGLSNLRKILQDMVAEGVLETRISKMGNTLYKLAE